MTASPGSDALSDAFERIEVRGFVTGGFAFSGPWRARGPLTRPFKMIALVAGHARLAVDGPGGPEGPLELAAGDVVLLNGRSSLEVSGGSGGDAPRELTPEVGFDAMALAAADLTRDDVLVGGGIDVNEAGCALLSASLPGLVHVRASTSAATRLAFLIAQLFREASTSTLGSGFAIRQYGQLVLLEVLRAYLDNEQPPTGWLRLLADESLAPALRLIHDQPGRTWSLVDLAAAACMSRTSFANRFRDVAGITPLAYVSRWRTVLAQRALQSADLRIGELAAHLGYGSESAFSTAFKRETGEAPLHYRRRHLPGAQSVFQSSEGTSAGPASGRTRASQKQAGVTVGRTDRDRFQAAV